MRFSGKMPKGFVLAKPIAREGYNESEIYKLEKEERLIITRKRDGWKMFAATDAKGNVRLYTDGMNEIDGRLDHIKKELKSLNISPNTLFVGEATVNTNNNDDITQVISIMQSKKEKSLAFQKKYGKISFMIFNVIFQYGEQRDTPYAFNLEYLKKLLGNKKKLHYILLTPTIDASFDDAKKIVVKNGWEGLVLYDKDFRISFRLDGKSPKRPKGCYKWKPMWEDDFIVREWIPRSNGMGVKELVLVQKDPVTKKEFECGKLGSFTNKMRMTLQEEKYPLVVQVEFEMRFRKSGKVRNARFMRIRTDKKIKNCISPKSYSPGK